MTQTAHSPTPGSTGAHKAFFVPVLSVDTPTQHVEALWPGFAQGHPIGNKSVLRNRSMEEGGADTRSQLVRRLSPLIAHQGARCDELLYVRSNTSPKDRAADVQEIRNYLDRLHGQEDKFISVNTFFGRRRHDNLKCLTALVVDLDLGKALAKGNDYRGNFMALRQDALDLLSSAGIPIPNFAVHSGKGVHFYWLFDQFVPAHAFPRWRSCLKSLIELLARVGADEAVKDSTRVLRLAGTINSTAPMHCRRVTSEIFKPDRYSFDFLADQILPITREDLQAQRKAQAAKRLLEIGPEQARRRVVVRSASSESRPGRRYSATAIDRLGDLTLLAKTAYPDGVEDGKRDQYLFAATVHLAWICRADTLQAQMLEWKTAHIPSMSDEEAINTMGTAMRRAQEAHSDMAAGIFKSVFDDARYVLSSDYLWAQFGDDITRAGLTDQMRTIMPGDVRKERKKQKQKAKSADHYTGHGIRQSNLAKAQKAHALKEEGLTYRAIAQQLGVAPKTVSNWLATPLDASGHPISPAAPTAPSPPPQESQPIEASYPQDNTSSRLLPKSSLNNGVAKQVLRSPSLMGPALDLKNARFARLARSQAPKTAALPDSVVPQQIPLIAEQTPTPATTAGESSVRKLWRHQPANVVALRQLPIIQTIERLGLYFKVDGSYQPKDSVHSERLHVTLEQGQVVELVFTGLLWFDKTSKKGAFGSIDLAMHLMGWTVKEALSKLDQRE